MDERVVINNVVKLNLKMSKSVLLHSSRRHILRNYVLQPLQSLTQRKIYIDRRRSRVLVERVSLLVVHSRADTVHHSVYIIRTSSVMNIENRRKHCRGIRLMYILRHHRHDTCIIQREALAMVVVVAVVVVITGVREGGFIATIFLASSCSLAAEHVFGDKSTLLGPALARG